MRFRRTKENNTNAKYVAAIHKAGHLVAVDSLILAMNKRGIRLWPHGCNPMKKEFYRANIVVTLAGTVAEYQINVLFLEEGKAREFELNMEVQELACSLLELLPTRGQCALRKAITSVLSQGAYWSYFWNLVFTIASETDRGKAVEEVTEDTYENGELAEVNAKAFEILWPLSQEARTIIDRQWSSVERVASDLLKAGSVEGDHTETGRPFLVR